MNSLAVRPSTLKLRIWPSLDFSIGKNAPREPRTRGDWKFRRYLLSLMAEESHGLRLEQLCSLFQAYESIGHYDEATQVAIAINKLTMGLSDATNSHNDSQQSSLVEKTTQNQGTQRAKRGVKGITSYGKKMVKSAAVLLEKRFGRQSLMFGTTTLPALTPEQMVKVCESWAEIGRQFFQGLQRLLARRGLSTDYVQVTEIQEKRFLEWGQIAPHFHWVCQSRRSARSKHLITPMEIRRLWERVLSNVLGCPVDGKAATRIETPRKSVGKELGKYMSKGGKLVYAVECAGRESELPSAWWGASRQLKTQVKQAIVELTDHRALFLDDNLAKLQLGGQISFRRIYQEINDFDTGKTWEICVGVTGWFTSEQALQKFLNSSIKLAA